MATSGLYSEEMTFTPARESFERKSAERDTVRAAMDDGVAGISDEVLTRAVMLVEDAIAGRKYSSKPDLASMQWHLWYHHWICQLIIRVVVLFHIGLAFFEWPATIRISKSQDVTIWVTGSIELLILAFYVAEIILKRSFSDVKDASFASNKNFWLNWLCIVLTGIDVVLSMALRSKYFRISAFVRPSFIIFNFPSVRHYFKNLRKTLPDIIHVFAVLFGLMIFYVLCVDVLLADYDDPSFPNTFRTFISLYITATTANFPDIMVYSVDNVSHWYAWLFASYSGLITKIMFPLVTAVMYNRYQYHIAKDVARLKKIRKLKLTEAFALLDPQGTGILQLSEWTILLARLRPKFSEEKIRLLFKIIDENGSETLKIREFCRIVSLLRLRITAHSTDPEQSDNQIAKHIPWFYRTKFFFFLRMIIVSKAFAWAMDLVVIASAIRVVVLKEVSVSLSARTSIESVLLALYVGEMACKLIALGTSGYWASNWNKFDGLLCIVSIISMIITIVPGVSSQELTRLTLVLRFFRLFRLGLNFENVRSLYQTMWRLVPTFAMQALALVVIYCEFAFVAMAIFKGKIYRGNPLLKGSSYEAAGFFNTSNFNSFGNALLTLFELMIQNNWHVIVQAHELVTNWAVWILFIFYNISTAVVIVNILIAFILDGFITQWKIVQLGLKTKVQIRIEELAAEGDTARQGAESPVPLQPEEDTKTGEMNALERAEQYLARKAYQDDNIIWTATDTSFRIDPLEFIEDEEDEE